MRLEPLEGRRLLSDGMAAATTLVKDFNPGSNSSTIQLLGDLNGSMLLSVAYNGNNGLWKSDGTTAGTTLISSNVYVYPERPEHNVSFAVVGRTAFFAGVGTDGTTGLELWKTDGTAAGTALVKDIAPGYYGSKPAALTNLNGTLYFADGPGLWKSDGTAAGTVLVAEVDAGNLVDPNEGNLVNANGTLFLSTGSGLWKSDGTASGTVLLKGGFTYPPRYLTNVNGKLFFSGYDGTNGWELWKSDGTTAGTVLVKDVYPGTTTTTVKYSYNGGHSKSYKVTNANSSYPRDLTGMGGTLYFSADDGTDGRELWKSDGTPAGTVLVKNIKSGGMGSTPLVLTDVNGRLFFSADGGNGWELWKSDGTAAGTALVKDINPGNGSSRPNHLINANGTLFFWADDGTHGIEPWKSDGTTAGTVLVKDINPGGASSYPTSQFTSQGVSGGHLFFTANDGVHGTELWDPPVGPAQAAVVVPTPGGVSRFGDSLWGGAGTLPSVVAPLSRPRQDGTGPPAERFTSSAPARAGKARPTEVLDRALPALAGYPKKAHFGRAPDRLWGPDLLEEFALSRPLG